MKEGKMSDNICNFMKCPQCGSTICTDTDEFFNKSGDMVCRFNGDAVRKTEVEKLRDEVAALRATLAEKEAELVDLREQNKVLREEENVPYLRELKENAELRNRLKLVEEVWVSWGYLDDYITKNVLTTKFAKEMWRAIKAACEKKENKK
jgi:hypothetical protein